MSNHISAEVRRFIVAMSGPPIGDRPDSPTMAVLAQSAEQAAAEARAHYPDTFTISAVHDTGPPRPADQVDEVIQEIDTIRMVSLRAEPWPTRGETTQVVASLSQRQEPTLSWPGAGRASLDDARAFLVSLQAVILAAEARSVS